MLRRVCVVPNPYRGSIHHVRIPKVDPRFCEHASTAVCDRGFKCSSMVEMKTMNLEGIYPEYITRTTVTCLQILNLDVLWI